MLADECQHQRALKNFAPTRQNARMSAKTKKTTPQKERKSGQPITGEG